MQQSINQGDRDENSTTDENVAKSDACRLHKVYLEKFVHLLS